MPNSLTDLNQYSDTTVVYDDYRPYSISFSANVTSNTSTTIDEDQSFVVPSGIDITEVISQPGNITYNVAAGTAGNVIGYWPTLPYGISNTSAGNVFSITGTFNAAVWQDVKNLTLIFPDKDTNFNFSANIVYPNTANVSLNNTWSWTNSVTIANTNPELTLTTNYNFNEDVPTTFVYSIDDLDPTATYTLTFDQISGDTGVFTVNGNSAGIGNIATISGNRGTVNAGNITFYPYPDSINNLQVYVSAIKTNPLGNTTIASNVAANLNCVGSHADYSLTTAYNYAEDTTTDIVFDILDEDPTVTSYTVNFAQSTGNAGVFFVDGVAQGIGNAVSISNSKANINAANVSFLTAPDFTGNVELLYTQIKTKPYFGNFTQVSNASINLTCTSTHSDYNFPTSGTYDEDQFKSFGNFVTDTDSRATSYTISLQQTSGNIGRWYLNGNLLANANSVLSLSNSKANINSANIQYLPAVDNTGNIEFTYNQSKVNSVFGNVVQAANIIATYSVGNTNSEIGNMVARTINANTVSNIFATTTPYIDDGVDVGQTYSISLTSNKGNFGNSAANAILSNTYTFTGNMTSVNNQFAGLVFVPEYNATSGTFTYTQARDGLNQANVTANLTVNASSFSPVTYTFTANSTFTPTFEEAYFGNARILVVGGGGGGAVGNVEPFAQRNRNPGSGGGGGGSASEFVVNRVTANAFVPATYNIVVGAGGSSGAPNGNGSAGGNSYITRSSVEYFKMSGGQGGFTDADNLSPWTMQGGNAYAANGAVILGGNSATAISNSVKLGGGGAGANETGFAPTGNITGNGQALLAGSGGNGFVSDITGTSTYYGGGGGGGVTFGSVGYIYSPPGNGTGGLGGGGSGGQGPTSYVAPQAGTNGLGGGGGGAGTWDDTGNGGGSGVIIIKIT